MPAKLTILTNGSIKVEGDFEVCDPQGGVFNVAGKPAVFLCRCGQSAKKPFCDGAHKTCGFTSEVKASA
ncbi:MAG: iron-binding protein [[Candidatus Thermochlorobacteriaceae] bacterium GBChlB]|jgi:CDGSH-type Zn-finger protein|nr:MAG: iron-binding protein [[Candidatus Thermochlorobacteriaceae] bacterium GBChlB]